MSILFCPKCGNGIKLVFKACPYCNCSPDKWSEELNLLSTLLTNASESDDDMILYYVARNPNTPPSILDKLSELKNPNIRVGVATNYSTNSITLLKLGNDTNEEVLYHVAGNINTDRTTLRKLSSNKNITIANVAKKNISGYPLTLDNKITNHKYVSSEDLTKFATSEDFDERLTAAENLRTSLVLLCKLAEDKSNVIRYTAHRTLVESALND